MAKKVVSVVDKDVVASAALGDSVLVVIDGHLYRAAIETLAETLTEGQIVEIQRATDELIARISEKSLETVVRDVEIATADLLDKTSRAAVQSVSAEIDSQLNPKILDGLEQLGDATRRAEAALLLHVQDAKDEADRAGDYAKMAEDAIDMVTHHTKTVAITINRSAWIGATEYKGEGNLYGYDFIAEIPVEHCTSSHYIKLSLAPNCVPIAAESGMCSSLESYDGGIRLWARSVPKEILVGDVEITVSLRSDEAPSLLIPVASESTLGGVIIKEGSGLHITEAGELSVGSDA